MQDRGRVLLFPLPNRGPKEDGGREWRSITENRTVILAVGAGFLPSPLLYGGPWKTKNSSGDANAESPDRRPKKFTFIKEDHEGLRLARPRPQLRDRGVERPVLRFLNAFGDGQHQVNLTFGAAGLSKVVAQRVCQGHGDGDPRLSAVLADLQPYRHHRSERTVIWNADVDLLEAWVGRGRQPGEDHLGGASPDVRPDLRGEPEKPSLLERSCGSEAGSVNR